MEQAGIANNTVHSVTTKDGYNTYGGRDFELSAVGFDAVNNAVSVREAEVKDVVVYPNPTRDNFFVNIALPATLEVKDFNGKLLTTLELQRKGVHKVDIRELQAGTYFIKITSDKNVSVSKLLIN